MRKIFFTITAMLSIAVASAQAPVPTSWDCSGTPPTGWSQVQTGTPGNLNYTLADLVISQPASARLDNTGEYILVNINDVPGLVSYYIKGSATQSTWNGTFTTQWSDNGTAWTTMRTFTNNLPVGTAAFLNPVDTPPSQARYIRFFFTTKQSGYNVAIDDISIGKPGPGPAQEIEALYNNVSVVNNGNIAFASPVSTPLAVTVKVKNLGTVDTLKLSGYALSGAAAADYSLTAQPAFVLANDSANISFTFTPSAAGTRQAKLQLTTNDADENPFAINLFGIGGNFFTEPSANPAITFSAVKAYNFTANVTPSSDGYLVLRKEGSAVTDAPADGTIYDAGQGIGSSKVFYVGNAPSFLVKEVDANTTYHFAVFAYNGFGSYINYKEAAPATGSQTSAGATPGSYYTGITPTAATFVTDLTNKINPHTQIFYSNYRATIVDNFYSRDTTGEFKVVNCEYSGQFVQYLSPFDFTAQNMSREHTFVSSWMPTFGKQAHEDRTAYSDLHNLHLVNQTDVNSPKGNLAYDEVVSGANSFLLSTVGNNAAGTKVYEPQDSIKGDIARAVFYMSTCYHNKANKASGVADATNSWAWKDLVIPGSFGNPDVALSVAQSQNLLKLWSEIDPVSNNEIARNEYVFSVQNNRNPFIDNPTWSCYIDFNTMNYIAAPAAPCSNTSVGIGAVENTIALVAYPNPAADVINIATTEKLDANSMINVYDIMGKVITNITWETSTTTARVDVSALPQGSYIVEVKTANGTGRRNIQVIR